jgi:hypothetical protein
VRVPLGRKRVTGEVEMGGFVPWSPDRPKLYLLDLSLQERDSTPVDRVEMQFGMRELSRLGQKLMLNGKPLFLRCFGEDHYYPTTLVPPASKDWFLDRLRVARQFGMNAAKSCVDTLPRAYLDAADEAGIIVIQEMPFGLSGLRAARHTITEEFRSYYSEELTGLVKDSRNHASVLLYSMSSELGFDQQTEESFNFFSRDLVSQTRALAPHAQVIDCTGYAGARRETSKGTRDTDLYVEVMPGWKKKVLVEPDIETDGECPIILHEYNWWSCYPDPNDRSKYEASQLKPFWLDQLVRTARENGQEEMIPLYRENSLWLQALCRKDGVEYARRNEGVEGYILWLLVDFGQYSEGLLDDFWNPKNVSAEEFLRSNGETVVLLGKEGNRCLTAGTTARIPLAVSHYGDGDMGGCALEWGAHSGSSTFKGRILIGGLGAGKLTPAGDAVLRLPDAMGPCKVELQVTLRREEEIVNTNDWSFWVFPRVSQHLASWEWGPDTFLRLRGSGQEQIPGEASLVATDWVDESLVEFVSAGGRCLLFSRGTAIENRAAHQDLFRTIPWNVGTTGNSGTVVTPHGALGDFPHDGGCDLQFLSVIQDFFPMDFGPLRPGVSVPIIRAIDHYKSNRNNAYLLEFRVGKGRVLATSLGVIDRFDERVEARYLFRCLLDYVLGEWFQPKGVVALDLFRELFHQRGDQ